MTVENTFGRWKGRFPRFSNGLDMEVDGAVEVVAGVREWAIYHPCFIENSELGFERLVNALVKGLQNWE